MLHPLRGLQLPTAVPSYNCTRVHIADSSGESFFGVIYFSPGSAWEEIISA